jgi:caffeoyl-CoA O-methyltransferase
MMQIDPNQGTLLTMLARLLNARFIVEVGTFTGYSSICLARGLAPGGRLLCLDVSEEWTAVARRYWERAGLSDRIELRLGPAGESLRALPLEESIDLAFIDADKPGYPDYYREILRRLRPGGLIAVDNVLWSGRVADPANHDPSTQTIREFNDMVIADDRVTSVMLPIADGVTLIRKEG